MIDFRTGSLPLLISFPHSGTDLPPEVARQMTAAGQDVPDTDWWLPRLYDFPPVHAASQIRANFSRYVIDPNRPPDGSNLYPGQPTPRLCPTESFAGQAIYREGHEPDDREVARRVQSYWRPYHERIQSELDDLQRRFGVAVLFDAHSIASRVPRLFDGPLPDLNVGTNHSASCDSELEESIRLSLAQQSEFSFVVNGRFVGGFLTRRFGQPQRGQHAIQLELSQATYMDESQRRWDDERAQQIKPILQGVLESILQWTRQQTKP